MKQWCHRFIMLLLILFIFCPITVKAEEHTHVMTDWLLDGGYDHILRSISHRGGDIAPENTLPAYRLAKRQGYNYVETDIQFTKDGIPVLLHDSTIDRTSDGKGALSDFTYEELLKFDFGSYRAEKYAGTKIPKFEEFLKLCKELGLYPYVEIKIHPTDNTFENMMLLTELVKQYGMQKDVTWISFSYTVLEWIIEINPNANVGILLDSISEKNMESVKKLSAKSKKLFIGCNYINVTEDRLQLAIESGIPLEVWTVNDVEWIKHENSYISGVTSDTLLAGKIMAEKIGYTGATCKNTGKQHRNCLHCDYFEKREIPKKKHVSTGSHVATCTKQAKCDFCGDSYGEKLAHDSVILPMKAATFENPGKTEGKQCKICDTIIVNQKEIPMLQSPTITQDHMLYTGEAMVPEVILSDKTGKQLKEGIDYAVSCEDDGITPGIHSAMINLNGNYEGSYRFSYVIVPSKVEKVKAELSTSKGGYDDVRVQWSNAEGAVGYFVYYKKESVVNYKFYKDVRTTSVLKKNLTDGVTYNFKVIPYYEIRMVKYYDENQYNTAKITTLKKVSLKSVKKSKKRIRIAWGNIKGETGYQISRSRSKKGTNVIFTIKSSKVKHKLISKKNGKVYYYKVRAYKVVNGKKIYAPWSKIRRFKY